jgi:hypothetical protein
VKRLVLHIDEVVLHGFAPSDRVRIGIAVETELTRLFTQQGVRAVASSQMPALDGGSFRVDASRKPEIIGRQVAKQIHQAVSRARPVRGAR